MAAEYLSAERLRELFEYPPLTGTLRWRVRTSNRVNVGDVAGCLRKDGYINICIDGRLYRAHRLAWLYMTGAWPTNQIDHIDGNRANNRWDNLREATRSQNLQNQRKARKINLSGLLGASWNKQRGKWQARIMIDGREHHLGFFATAELAHAAYLTEKRRIHQFCSL